MSEAADTPFPDHNTEPGLNFVSVLLADQNSRWKQGERVPAEDYLRRWPTIAENPEDVYRLILGEMTLRQRHGELPSLEEYCQRFPTYADTLLRLYALFQTFARSSPDSLLDSELPTIPGYELIDIIGQGAAGIVYRARHVSLGRFVALKVLKPGIADEPSARERFRVEAKSAASLSHPHIVSIYDVGEFRGLPYLAMEWVDGISLKERLAEVPLQPRESATLLARLAAGLEAAHARGVVHRDLKPANILLQKSSPRNHETLREDAAHSPDIPPDFCPKIADFGLAKRLDDIGQTRPGDIIGTPAYMAPEQAGGFPHAVGPTADIYALGAILFECLTGRPPFQAATVLETLAQVKNHEPLSPRALNPSVPRDLETICLKCLSKEPSQRYPRTEDLTNDLHRFLAGKPVRARPVGTLARTFRWCKRNRAVAVLLGVVSLLLVVGTPLFFVLWRQARDEAGRADARRLELQSEQEALRHLVSEQVRLSNEVADGLDENRVQRAAALGQLANFYRERFQGHADDPTSRLMLADILHALSLLHHAQGRLEESGRYLLEEMSLLESQDDTPDIKERRRKVAELCDTLGDSFIYFTFSPRAREWYRRGEKCWSRLEGEQCSAQERIGILANRVRLLTSGNETLGYAGQKRLDGLLDELSAELCRQQKPSIVAIRVLHTERSSLGELNIEKGDLPAAVYQLQKAIQEADHLIGDETGPKDLRYFRGDAYLQLVGRHGIEPYYSKGVKECEDYHRRGMSYLEGHPNDLDALTKMTWNLRQLAAGHQRACHRDRVVQVYSRVATLNQRLVTLLSVQGREDELLYERLKECNDAVVLEDFVCARAKLREAKDLLDRLTARPDPPATVRETKAFYLGRLSMFARKAEVPLDEAFRYSKEACDLYRNLTQECPGNAEYAFGLFDSLEFLGKVYIAQDRDDEAEQASREAIAILRPFATRGSGIDEEGYRVRLLRRSLRLAKHLRLHGRLSDAEACLVDQEPFTPLDASALEELGKEFLELAKAVGLGKNELSADEKTQQSRYQDEAARIQRRAEELRRASQGP